MKERVIAGGHLSFTIDCFQELCKSKSKLSDGLSSNPGWFETASFAENKAHSSICFNSREKMQYAVFPD